MQHHSNKIHIVYYTDPLCCWSWGFEPCWERLLREYADHIIYTYCMGGMISNWTAFNDPLQNIHRPSQMGPMWVEARQLTGMHINENIWVKDPPDSSYPACVAVKAAGLQSSAAAEQLLKAVRKAVMLDGQNIADKKVLKDIAKQTAEKESGELDFDRFCMDFYREPSLEAFRDDLKKVRYHQISRFPTLTFTNGAKGVMITGYRPYEVLQEALCEVAHHLRPMEKKKANHS